MNLFNTTHASQSQSRSLRLRFLAAAIAAVAGVGTFGVGHSSLALAETPTTNTNPPAQQDPAAMARIDDLASAMRNVGHALKPSVVLIEIEKRQAGHAQQFDSDMLKRFFPDRDGDGQPDLPRGFRMPQAPDDGGSGNDPNDNAPGDNNSDDGNAGGGMKVFGEGSGVILDVDGNTGYILTNNHVAGDATKLTVTLSDGRKIENVTVVGTDPLTDLAVVKIEAEDLHGAKGGDSEHLEQGDIVLAFGAPFNYVGSMTQGIVSALNRSEVGILGQNGYENFIQTDCAINPGNSGGPLVNLHGEVIGVNTAIATRTGEFSGIGFAIPSQLAQHVYHQLKDDGHVTRGFLGVKIQDTSALKKQQATKLGLAQNEQGVYVSGFQDGTPAVGKLEPNDVILTIDGQPVHNRQDLRFKIATTTPGTNVKLGVLRGGERKEVEITVGTLPGSDESQASKNNSKDDRNGANLNAKDIGATLADATAPRLRAAGLPAGTKGALVTQIRPNSPAQEAGLELNDVIKKVGDKTVNNASEAQAAIRAQDLKAGYDILVQKKDGTQSIFVQSDGTN